MRPAPSAAALISLVLSTALAACGGDGSTINETPPQRPYTLSIVGGQGAADTIDARAATPLTVEVHSATGAPVANAGVLLTAPDPSGAYDWPILLVHPTTTLAVPSVLVHTDATGRASIVVQNGHHVGTYRVAAALEGLPATDSATIQVTAGHPVAIRVLPADTAVYVGRDFPMHLFIADRLGDSAAAAAVVVRRPGVGTRGEDGIYHPVAIGRAWVVASAPQMSQDSAAVSVVPVGTVATTGTYTSPRPLFYAIDGSRVDRVPLPDSIQGDLALRWAPSGGDAVFEWLSVIFRLAPSGQATPLVHGEGTYTVQQPRYSGDGGWIYYLHVFWPTANNEIWRMRPDGSGVEQVGAGADLGWMPGQVSTSPDGSLLAIQTSDGTGTGAMVRVYDPSAGSMRPFFVWGEHPRWSPTADEIVYLSEGLHFITPDGSPSGTVSSIPGAFYTAEWSADGTYLVTCAGYATGNRITIVERATGEVMRLAYPADHCDASWKP